MATALLSQHSSNPLEVGSSDLRNRRYRTIYNDAQAAFAPDDPTQLSEDPISGYGTEELVYLSHIAEVNPMIPKAQQEQYGGRGPVLTNNVYTVDLDEDMVSDDDLLLATPKGKGRGDVGVRRNQEDVGGEGDDIDVDSEEEHEEDDRDTEGEDEEDDEDVPSSDDEEHTILKRSSEERTEIFNEIHDLERTVPCLLEDYKLVDRLGTGTFSSVYKAVDLNYHDKWDNTPWHGHHPPTSSAHYQSVRKEPGTKVFVAIKRIYVTSSPERIRNEIAILEDCRGCRHTSQLITAFREDDQVVAIMPYQKNEDFRDFYSVLPMAGIKAYFRSLFRALRDIHARGIIHRDVKPANFLFDPRTGVGTLCDFGLACRMEPGPSHNLCLHTPPSLDHPHGRLKNRGEYDGEYIKKMHRESNQRSTWPSDRVGYPEKDIRPHSKANRAGTRGFRAPEVLLKCGDQSGAIDVWSAGMILLFFLTGKFPLFQSNDDVEALMEIATIIGKKKMERVAMMHSRTFTSNVPSINNEGMLWRTFIEKQNQDLYSPPEPDPRFYPYSQMDPMQRGNGHPPQSSSPDSRRSDASRSSPNSPRDEHFPVPNKEDHARDVDTAIALVERIMHPESIHRLTPRDVLYSDFLCEGVDEPEDDEFFPHPFGSGVCGQHHFRDDVTEEPCVKVFVRDKDAVEGDEEGYRTEVRRLVSGEGIAIGREPCEFHRDIPMC